jgi:serine/threonine protein kinase
MNRPIKMLTFDEKFQPDKKEPIYVSNNSVVYSGYYKERRAILKAYPNEIPPDSVKKSYQRDFNFGTLLFEKHPEYFGEPLKIFQESNKLYVIKPHEGEPLSNGFKDGKHFSVEEFLKIGIEVCESLQLIHEQNIIHCDLKPQNILHKNQRKKCTIIDFESSFLVSLKNPKVANATKGNLNYLKQ